MAVNNNDDCSDNAQRHSCDTKRTQKRARTKPLIPFFAGMMLPEDPDSRYRYPLRQRTHTFALTSVLEMVLQVQLLSRRDSSVSSLEPYFDTDICSAAMPLYARGASNYSYNLVVRMQSAAHRELGLHHEVFGVYDFKGHEEIPRTLTFAFNLSLLQLTIHHMSIMIYLERRGFLASDDALDAAERQSLKESVGLLDVETFLHSVTCDMEWTAFDSSTARHEVGSTLLLSTKCTVPLGPSDDEFSDSGVSFECYVSGSVALAVYPTLYHKSITVTASQRAAIHIYTVEIPLLSTGAHVLKSKITYFDGHGRCDVGSSKYSTHFPVSHPLQDYLFDASPPGDTLSGAHGALPFCSVSHLFHSAYDMPAFESAQSDIYWLNVETCKRNDILPHDTQRCAAFQRTCNLSDSGPSAPGSDGAASAHHRLCNSSWMIANRNCIMNFAMSPSSLLASPAHVNIARLSSRFPSVVAYGSSLSEMNTFNMVELLGVPSDCLRNWAGWNDMPMNCVFFSHATNSSASFNGSDTDTVMRVNQTSPDRKTFEVTSASPGSSLKGVNISYSNYPEPCRGESYICAFDNLPPKSRVWQPDVGHVIDLGAEKIGEDVRHCSKESCPVCLWYSHCFRKVLSDDIRNLTRGGPALLLLELPFAGKAEMFTSNLNVVLHALADSLAPGSCVLLHNGHGLHSNKDVDRRFPMRANLSSRMLLFSSLMSKMWLKAWFTHQDMCDEDAVLEPSIAKSLVNEAAETSPPECRNEIDATGLVRLLRVLNAEENSLSDGNSEDVCRFGVANIDTYAFGSGRPDASRDGVHYYAESGNKQFRMGNEVVVNVVSALMSVLL
jgi:hypothetical protein